MPFAIHEIVEIEASQFRVVARVRNVQGDRIHVAIEQGGYLPWIDDPVLIRRVGEPGGVDARIVHVSGTTALLELLNIIATAASSGRLPRLRDTTTNEG